MNVSSVYIHITILYYIYIIYIYIGVWWYPPFDVVDPRCGLKKGVAPGLGLSSRISEDAQGGLCVRDTQGPPSAAEV